MVTAIGSVLTELGVVEAALIGHSMGCQWVVELAVQRPDLAELVVIMGPVADGAHRLVLAERIAGCGILHPGPSAERLSRSSDRLSSASARQGATVAWRDGAH